MRHDAYNILGTNEDDVFLAQGGPLLVLIVLGFAAVVIVGIVFSFRAARMRREAMQRLAAETQMTYDADLSGAPTGGGSLFPVFQRGDDRRSLNTLTGTATLESGRPVGIVMGDYRYTIESGSGKDRRRTTTHLSYLLARLPFAVAMQLAVRREGFFDRIAGAIGFEDIDFESAEFSKLYHVSSSDKKIAYDVFDPRMIEWCMAFEIPSFEIRGDRLLMTDMRTWTPEQFRARREWLLSFLNRLPAHLVQRLTAASAGTPADSFPETF